MRMSWERARALSQAFSIHFQCISMCKMLRKGPGHFSTFHCISNAFQCIIEYYIYMFYCISYIAFHILYAFQRFNSAFIMCLDFGSEALTLTLPGLKV